MICAPWLVSEQAEKSTSRILGDWFKCRQRTAKRKRMVSSGVFRESYCPVLRHQSDCWSDGNEREIYIWQCPEKDRKESQLSIQCPSFTCTRIVRSFRRNGRPSSSRTTNSVAIRRQSLICVQIFDKSSFDWNIGGRFEADDARFNVRRSAKRHSAHLESSSIPIKPSAKLFDDEL